MSFQRVVTLLVIGSSFCLIPAQSSGSEQILLMPLAKIAPADTMNHYRAPMTEYGSGHRGIDLPVLMGSLVLSPANGQISFAGKVGYRNVVSVRFGNSLSASVEPVCSELFEGSQVSIGDEIGLVCEPDPEYVWHCAETCLHFGTRSEAGYFSPLAIIGGLSPSKLAYQARG